MAAALAAVFEENDLFIDGTRLGFGQEKQSES
jgi:hypothetical protein